MIKSEKIRAILARDSQNHIANKSSLPWKNDGNTRWDMARFKEITSGNIVYMGYNTFLTFKAPLPARINVVEDRAAEVSAQCHFQHKETELTMSLPDVPRNLFFHAQSLEEFIECKNAFFNGEQTERKIFLIGGARLLKKYADFIDEFYLTTFYRDYGGDVFFDDSILENFSEKKIIETHENGIIEIYSKF